MSILKTSVVAIDLKVSGNMNKPTTMATIPKSMVKAAALLPNDAKGRPFRDCRR
jgi:hypothetical protein